MTTRDVYFQKLYIWDSSEKTMAYFRCATKTEACKEVLLPLHIDEAEKSINIMKEIEKTEGVECWQGSPEWDEYWRENAAYEHIKIVSK